MDYRGSYTNAWLCAVDAKGRVSVPASLRKTLAKRCAEAPSELKLRRHTDAKFISVYDNAHYEYLLSRFRAAEEDDLDNLINPDPKVLARRASIFGAATEVNIDNAGRIILSNIFRRTAGIADQVMFVGMGEYFEIWSPEVAEKADWRPDLAERLEELREEKAGN